MLDAETKLRIDSARQMLVGKVPDPKSQVEQITIALIYKFMDDMDAEAVELGGKRKFFTGKFAKYGWAQLMSPSLGGHDMLALYSEGIDKMPENPGIPLLFRDIFKNAYLPYRDPETLKGFLKIINEFNYDHSERLGDAFEYLLSVLGSQGDAGQFRTPRHVIDFIVKIVNPQKGEVVLDPACGTAGFLISAWKHIVKANTDAKGHSKLTPADRGKLAENFKGYDISPDMVRLSLVNMYLHGFTDPHIYEYDTLTSDERWNEYADVILANPPFMSPTGGIKPHKRFSIQAKRSEVLFVDYMAEHLTPKGRAGIIVPEGIIFQSQTAYKQLRKLLVEDYLVAVVSLPAGCFNPYSGVKTSILILDKVLAKQAQTVAFFKVENDGFNLGAQRRPIEQNDLPKVRAELSDYLDALKNKKPVASLNPALGLIVPKEKIAANGNYNLSGERFRENGVRTSGFPHVRLDAIAEIAAGNPAPQGDEYFKEGKAPFVRTSDVGAVHFSAGFIGSADRVNQKAIKELRLRLFPEGTILFPKSGASTFLNHRVVLGEPAYVSSHLACIICDESKALPRYVYSLLCGLDARQITPDQAYPSLRLSEIGAIEIPMPPLEVQKEIVAEIEGYQKVIDGAQAVIDNYRPHIPIHPDWSVLNLGDIVSYLSGGTPSKAKESYWVGNIPWVSAKDMKRDVLSDASTHISEAAVKESATQIAPVGALLILVRGMGLANGVPICELASPCAFNQDVKAMRPREDVNSTFLRLMLRQEELQFRQILETAAHGTLKINTNDLSAIKISLPPVNTQKIIVAEIEAEQTLINANRELIARFEKKIQATLARVWGEDGNEKGQEAEAA